MQKKFQLLEYSSIFVSLICLAMIYQAVNCDFLPHYRCTFFLIIPIFIFGLINILSRLMKWKKSSKDVLSLCFLTITFFYLMIIELYLLAGLQLFSNGPIKPPITRYNTALRKLKNQEWKHGLDHFPIRLPLNLKNYYFQIETSFDGYDTHYVKFDTDKAFINSLKRLNKNKCKPSITNEEKESYELKLHISEIKKNNEICILHKSIKEEPYTSGIAINNKTNTVYYFYSNF